MASKFSTEFRIFGVNYLLASGCSQHEWETVQSRVKTALINLGKSVKPLLDAADMSKAVSFGPRIALQCNVNLGQMEINHNLVAFELTINPEGNQFR